ncbi:Vegetative incompatibility protein HET-E-1 [Hondaea fermentalgiana]|uniref:Vegetative incompatibility protein HET-E-1 n=1 Tax=Hondaea fermentalgiana TaxID=2315210 RepID=A0A2R5GU41_9STRA|nr:Vegetative incompatibility protein HET-E-1 [Hondaea fermentalgiana]|eukprot:GBG33839.1 Vegetative incompatibility protein HET-E-1 [Hondaea fermentalgiana]
MGRFNDSVWSVAQSADLILAATRNDASVRAWSKDGRALVVDLKMPQKTSSVALQGTLAAIGTQRGGLFLVDLLTSAILHSLQGHTEKVRTLVLRGTEVFSGSLDATIRAWNIVTGTCSKTISAGARVAGLAVQNDTIVAGLDDHTVRVFDRASGEQRHVLTEAKAAVTSVALDAKRLVSGAADNYARVYAVPSYELVHVLKGHTHVVASVSLQDDRIMSGSHDKSIRVWDAQNGDLVHVLQGDAGSVLTVNLLGSEITSGSEDSCVQIWEATTGALKCTLRGGERRCKIDSVLPRPERLPNVDHFAVRGHMGCVYGVTQSTELVLACSDDACLRAWSKDGALVLAMKMPNNRYAVCAAVQGHLAAVSTFYTGLYLIDLFSGAILQLHGHAGNVRSLLIDNDVVLTGSEDKTIRVWDTSSGACIKTISTVALIMDMAVHGNLIAAGLLDNTLRVFDRVSGAQRHVLTEATELVRSVAIDAHRLVSGADDSIIRIYTVPSFQLIRAFQGHVGWVTSIARERDCIVTGSNDMKLKVWDAENGKLLHEPQGHKSVVTSVSLLASEIVSGSHDSSVRIWNAETGVLTRTLVGTESTRHIAEVFGDDSARITAAWPTLQPPQTPPKPRGWHVFKAANMPKHERCTLL